MIKKLSRSLTLSNNHNIVLFKTLVTGFYRQNAGLFFVLLVFVFAFLRGEEHYYLMMSIMHSSFILSLCFGLWTLYWIKMLYFSWSSFHENQHQFLYQLFLYPIRLKVSGLMMLFLLQFLPVLIYLSFLISLGTLHARWINVGLCLLYIIGTAFLFVLYSLYLVRHPNWELSGLSSLKFSFKKPAFSFYFSAIQHKHKLSFFFTKIFTLAMISFVGYLYQFTTYDGRFAALIATLAGISNAVLIYYYHYFENVSMGIQRNLPFSLDKRFIRSAFVILLMLLPEVIVFFKVFWPYLKVVFLIQASLLPFVVSMLLYSYLFTGSLKKEEFLLRSVALVLIFYFLIIFSIPLWGVTAGVLLLAYMLFVFCYNSFEYTIEPD